MNVILMKRNEDKTMEKFDVIIVGACTAGTYLSKLLAKRGLKVLVIDKDKEEHLSKRLDIFHFTTQSFKDFQLEPVNEGEEAFVRRFNLGYSKSALDQHPKKSFLDVTVMHLPLFIKRLRFEAIAAGVTFKFSTSFSCLTYDDNHRINGIKDGSGETYCARLVVDASGIASVVRKAIKDPYIETFDIGPKDKFKNLFAHGT